MNDPIYLTGKCHYASLIEPNTKFVNVKAIPYEWDYAGKSGVSADLAAVQVVDFIEYTASREDFDPVDGGYVTDSSIPAPAFS